MTIGDFCQCYWCKHYDRDDLDEDTCMAFPDGIPRKILLGKRKHDKPIPGDHDIQFEPKK